MYNLLKSTLLRLLRVPPEPKDPLGAPGSLLVFLPGRAFYKYRLVLWGIGEGVLGLVVFLPVFVLLVGGAAAAARESGGVAILLLLATLLWIGLGVLQFVFGYTSLRLDYEMRWYKVTDRSLRIREGIWFLRETTFTFANIQNMSIEQGPIQRLLGISDLAVQTAGGGGMVAQQGAQAQQMGIFQMHIAHFRGVDNAEKIRDIIMQRLKHLKDSGLGDLDDASEAIEHAPPGAPALDPGTSPALRDALAELHAEAKAFRAAAARLANG